MKTILVILDGVSEERIAELDGKTPLEYANTPTLDKIVKYGSYEKKKFYPDDSNPDSLNCILTMLGVKMIPKNRAYLEALAAGIEVDPSEVAFRCNLISIKDGKLESFNGRGLSAAEMEAAARKVSKRDSLRFYHISNYRNIIVVKKSNITSIMEDMPPHEHIGEPVDRLLKCIRDIEVLNRFAEENRFAFNNVEYMFYPWGLSEVIKLPTYYELHNKSCSCICNAEIVKGIAKAMNIDTPLLRNSTGDVDTDLKEKAAAVLRELKSHDVVIAHINGTDEVSHRKDLFGKIGFIEKLDREFLSTIYEQVKDNVKIIIAADHQTSSITGKHEKGFVDYIVSNHYEGMN